MIAYVSHFVGLVLVFLASTDALNSAVGLRQSIKPSTTVLMAGFGKLPDKIEAPKVELADGNCKCGSGITYISCCKPFHEGTASDPSSLIRSRYSAYSSSNIDYIISTTSKASTDYIAFIDTPIAPTNGLKRWAKSIKSNMLDQYQYVRMEIISAEETEAEATVMWRHLAIRRGDNLMYPIEEKSELAKVDGTWTYVKGTVARPDPEVSQTMMNDWPAVVGLELKYDDESLAASSAGKQSAGQKRPMMDFEGSKKFKPKQSQSMGSQKKNSERSGSP